MSEHRFNIGQTLQLSPLQRHGEMSTKACKVLRLLSTDGNDPQYRVKCTTEAFERVVRQSELS